MTTPVDITLFCGKFDIRPWMHKPLTLGSFVYASNGHILVRIPAPPGAADNVVVTGVPKNLASMFDNQEHQRPADMPDLSEVKPCNSCKGKGTVTGVECKTCDGDGWFDRDGHEYECQSCDGNGYLEADGEPDAAEHCCLGCSGHGYPFAVIPMGDSRFAAHYLKRLEALPNIKAHTNGPDKAGLFTFDGGEALLMPCRP